MEHYTNKRIAELNRQIIHDRLKSIALDKAVNDIHIRHQGKKQAPSVECFSSVGAFLVERQFSLCYNFLV